MDLSECIRNRRSIRKYTQQPVEFDKITKIIEAGHEAPSAGNLQNWRFILITDKNVIRSLYNHCLKQEQVYNAQAIIVVCGVVDIAERFYGLRGKRLYTTQNCACAIQNMLLTAYDVGLGACWIGAFDEDKIRSTFNIPENTRPQALITLGYPDEIPKPPHKDELAGVVYFHKYGARIKELHIVLRDYSVEWEKQIAQAQESIDKGMPKIVEKTKSLIDYLSKKFKEYNKEKKKKIKR
ncbi:MAG: nitroreductase family protein [Nanoarchaeota archaeon]|nr:nitroreductase family protein [Nanoarchaeota archaeon]MBU1030746.1 nitroreductase family protein [Nanoarchaeota archaeon]MBU1849923.1 nitroreductase family protein [Nanoarchaeota archaeon]